MNRRTRRAPLVWVPAIRLLLGVIGLLVPRHVAAQGEFPSHQVGEDLLVRRIAPGVWQHITFPDAARSGTAATGLVVTTGELSIMIDAGWTESQAQKLLQWADESLGQPVRHLIVTHAHPDRIGGIAAVLKQPVITHGHAATAAIVNRGGPPVIEWTFEFEEHLELGGEVVELFYPGPGHSFDNIVVWLPRRKVLFAGCLVRALADDGLGDIGDASLENWPLAMRRLIDKYRDPRLVVPGHGRPGGVELFSHTMEQLEAATGSASPRPGPTP